MASEKESNHIAQYVIDNSVSNSRIQFHENMIAALFFKNIWLDKLATLANKTRGIGFVLLRTIY